MAAAVRGPAGPESGPSAPITAWEPSLATGLGRCIPSRWAANGLHDRLCSPRTGLTPIIESTARPTRIYVSKGRIKCEIALVKAEQVHGKRDANRKVIEASEAQEAAFRRHLRNRH